MLYEGNSFGGGWWLCGGKARRGGKYCLEACGVRAGLLVSGAAVPTVKP